MLNRWLFTKIDNSPLIIFRIFFGILVALECYGAIFTGWIRRTLIEPEFTFTFIGFEWLQPLPGFGMYYYFFIMGTLGLCIAIGYKYRLGIISFTVMWTAVYLMQKSAYNNHYYLLVLISLFMCFFPAQRAYSIDVRKKPEIKSDFMPSYVKWIFVLQLFIMYSYASIAKLYGDWLDLGIIRILMLDKADYPLIGQLLQETWLHNLIGIFGILFDLLIVPALLWKPTRKWAFITSIFFHLFNSVVFQIGIFPYLSLAFTVFFFEPKSIQNIFFKRKTFYGGEEVEISFYKTYLVTLMAAYFLIQVSLPLRHYFIKDNVLWTEEGHRLSWRMMLRSRAGITDFNLVNLENGDSFKVNLDAYLTSKQKEKVVAYPDFMWQFAQHLKKEHAKKGEKVSVFVSSKISINGKPFKEFINPKIDMANTDWDHFRHHEWILPYESEDPIEK